MRRHSEQSYQEASKKYDEGYSPRKVQEITGVGRKALLDYRRSKNLPMRSKVIAQTKYTISHSFFTNINTVKKAYWLGVMAADGVVNKLRHKGHRVKGECYSYRVGLAFAYKDIQHLELLKKHTRSTHPIKIAPNHSHGLLVITSQQMVEDLIDKGVGYRKSLKNILPSERAVPEHLFPHFLRGYFDGDGCVGIKKKKDNLYQLSADITCGIEFGQQLYEKLGYGSPHVTKDSRGNRKQVCKYFFYHGNAIRFLKYIYRGSKGCRLERKFATFQQFILDRIRKYQSESSSLKRKNTMIMDEDCLLIAEISEADHGRKT